MQRTASSGARSPDNDLARVIRGADIARWQFLGENSGNAMRLIGWSTVACGFALLALGGLGPSPRQILENTTLMEQLATKLGRIDKLAPGTVAQVTELLHRPDYDCREVRCDTALEKRNAAARLELERAAAKHSGPATRAASK